MSGWWITVRKDRDQKGGKYKNVNMESRIHRLVGFVYSLELQNTLSLSLDLLLIMFTSLAPSPMDMVIEVVCFLTNVTMSAFCPGVTRQHSTD